MQGRQSHTALAEILQQSLLEVVEREGRTVPFLRRAVVKKKLENLQELCKLTVFSSFWPIDLSSSSCLGCKRLQLLSSGARYVILHFPVTWLGP